MEPIRCTHSILQALSQTFPSTPLCPSCPTDTAPPRAGSPIPCTRLRRNSYPLSAPCRASEYVLFLSAGRDRDLPHSRLAEGPDAPISSKGIREVASVCGCIDRFLWPGGLTGNLSSLRFGVTLQLLRALRPPFSVSCNEENDHNSNNEEPNMQHAQIESHCFYSDADSMEEQISPSSIMGRGHGGLVLTSAKNSHPNHSVCQGLGCVGKRLRTSVS